MKTLPLYPDASMSGLDLLLCCQAWAVGTIPVKDEPSGPAARFGNGIHLLLQWHIDGRVVDLEGACVAERVDQRDWSRFVRVWDNLRAWLDRQDTRGWKAEVAYAYDPLERRAREIGRGIRREYAAAGKRDHELCGTADIVIVEQDRVTVYDLKTGKSPAERYRMQLLGLGHTAALVEGKAAVRVGVLKADEGIVDLIDTLEAGPDELRWMADSIEAAWLRPSGEPMPGDHCVEQWCKARKTCPARWSV